jgi:hypothetical protein
MARTATSTKAKTPAKARKPSRTAPVAKSAQKAKPAATPKKAKKIPTVAAPKLTVGELRAQLEKLQSANATLRAKNRETSRMMKTATARIAELEEKVTRLEKELAAKPTPAKRGPSSAVRTKRLPRDVDPSDAMPPGVAVEEPAPLDEEAETARENPESTSDDT